MIRRHQGLREEEGFQPRESRGLNCICHLDSAYYRVLLFGECSLNFEPNGYLASAFEFFF